VKDLKYYKPEDLFKITPLSENFNNLIDQINKNKGNIINSIKNLSETEIENILKNVLNEIIGLNINPNFKNYSLDLYKNLLYHKVMSLNTLQEKIESILFLIEWYPKLISDFMENHRI